MNDLVGACIVIDASVNIIYLAGKLKDIPYRKQKSTKRLYRQVMPSCWRRRSIYVDVFHTFDDGGKKGSLPLLSYHEWCDGLTG
jgi:hypothetical protein